MVINKMTTIIESRYSRITNKIIKLKNIIRLAKLVHDEYNNSLKNKKYSNIHYSVICHDDTAFESKEIDLFSEESPIHNKRIKSIKIFFHGLNDFYITILFEQSKYIDSFIIIEGSDSKWVNGTYRQIDDIINSFTPQNTLIKDYKWISTILLGSGIGILYFIALGFIINLLPFPTSSKPDSDLILLLRKLIQTHPIYKYIIAYLLSLSFGIFPASLLTNKLINLWPTIEFQIGPEHTFIEKQRRNWLVFAISLIILPILTGIIVNRIIK